MTPERYNELMQEKTQCDECGGDLVLADGGWTCKVCGWSWAQAELTPEEIAEGWHWCVAWDGLLVGPGMRELEWCECDEE